MSAVQYHALSDGRRIAYRFVSGCAPAVVFLPGYKSDMAGEKAAAVFAAAEAEGRACLLLDYSGCGLSDGDFADGTLSRWQGEVLALIDAQLPARTGGPLVVVGSSMGGWLMLLVALALVERDGAARVAGLVGIAPAPDFTDWGIAADDAARLAAGEVLLTPSIYGPEPTPTHPDFWADAQGRRVLDAPLPLDAPVRLLHGQADGDVPWTVSLQLAEVLRSEDVQVLLIKDGDHRLSRPADIARLLRTIADLIAAPT